jgi:hypothetical protein
VPAANTSPLGVKPTLGVSKGVGLAFARVGVQAVAQLAVGGHVRQPELEVLELEDVEVELDEVELAPEELELEELALEELALEELALDEVELAVELDEAPDPPVPGGLPRTASGAQPHAASIAVTPALAIGTTARRASRRRPRFIARPSWRVGSMGPR